MEITIKQSKGLLFIAERLAISCNDLSELIIKEFVKMEILEDGPGDFGLTIQEACENSAMDVEGVGIMVLKTSEHQILEQFKYLWFVNIKELGCPECGCELEEVPTSELESLWIDNRCTRCDYFENNDPHTAEKYQNY